MRKTKGLTQAYAVLDVVFNAIQTFGKNRLNDKGEVVLGEDDAQKLAQLVKAFDTAQDRVRIQRNKALPGSLKHETKRKPTKSVNPMDIVRMVQPETPTGTNG